MWVLTSTVNLGGHEIFENMHKCILNADITWILISLQISHIYDILSEFQTSLILFDLSFPCTKPKIGKGNNRFFSKYWLNISSL